MPFALYEYDAAFTRFFIETVRTLARARSPILSQIQFVEVPGTVGSRVRDRQGMDVVLEPGKTSTEVTADLKAVREGDYEQLYGALDEAADSMAEQLVGFFVETMNKVTEGTGNVIDAGGKPLSFGDVRDGTRRTRSTSRSSWSRGSEVSPTSNSGKTDEQRRRKG